MSFERVLLVSGIGVISANSVEDMGKSVRGLSSPARAAETSAEPGRI